MIDRQSLLSDLQALLKRLEADLLERSESTEIPDVGQTLRVEYDRAKKAERTAQNYEDWRSDAITQAAAAWVLSCVFVRFLEDNRLIDPPKIAGPKERLQQARDEHELYFREHPTETDREYLLAVFDELAKLPGTKDVFGEHNPVRELPNWLSGDAAGELLRFFQKIDANTGELIHDFADHDWDTRFLGDLYQDLSEAARKKYALLQTPEFVEEFILDRTLDPAIEEFGLEGFKMIDPACGSGHFLLGAFRRIENLWERKAPDAKCREVVQWTLDSIFGVDVNPYAVAIARFRLLLAALRTCGVLKLADSPAFQINLVCGDSLLHAPLAGGQQVFDFDLVTDDSSPANDKRQMTNDNSDECDHAYRSENLPELKRLLGGGQYHAVVANPPYIVPRDKQLNERYRKRFTSCHRQYSLAVPFLERIFRLAVAGGYTGQITANSFMKREFGKKLIESLFPSVDLTHVIDTSGAYIPGHGTPTVILLGRHRPPMASTLRTVMGIRGEPSTPDDPALGLVWSAIVTQLDQPGSQSDFVSVGDSPRELFHKHPWSIGGGGAAELKEHMEELCEVSLEDVSTEIGRTTHTGEDDAFYLEPFALTTRGLRRDAVPLVTGEDVRDYEIQPKLESLFPYDKTTAEPISRLPTALVQHFWRYRTNLRRRRDYGQFIEERGLRWFDHSMFFPRRFRTPLSIAFACVATHNHFVLDRGGNLFNRHAPVIKLPRESTVDDHLGLFGLLNSSTACFWMKQIFHDKGSTVDAHGARQTTVAFENFREFTATGLLKFPLPADRPLELTRRMDALAQQLQATGPQEVLTQRPEGAKEEGTQEHLGAFAPLRESLSAAREQWDSTRRRMIAYQEELDWECYRLYELMEEDLTQRREDAKEDKNSSDLCASAPLREPPHLSLGERAFEIVLARKMAAGETQTTWFERHGSTPITELPAHWPDDYRQLVQRRIDLIESDPNIRLIEQPEYKRRWNTEPWDSQLERALRQWLLDRLESYFDFDGRMRNEGQRDKGAKGQSEKNFVPLPLCHFATCELVSIAKLADVARQDAEFQQVGELYRDDPAFDVQNLIAELVAAECVPLLPVLRYKPPGLRKRAEWEKTWELQRLEDAIDARAKLPESDPQYLSEDQTRDLKRREIGDIPVPPKYKSSDFISTGGARYWALRGKLDVPKERWVSFPHCEGPDGTLVIAWAGYDHLQLARAISAYFVDIQERLGGRDDPRLVPLLACIIELLPWLKQWHHDIDPDYNQRMDEVFEGFVTEEAKNLGMTIEEVKAWQPPKKAGRQKRK